MANPTNPNEIGSPISQYAGFVAPKRADASTVAPGGNTVDKSKINRTYNGVDGTPSAVKPLGPITSSGF